MRRCRFDTYRMSCARVEIAAKITGGILETGVHEDSKWCATLLGARLTTKWSGGTSRLSAKSRLFYRDVASYVARRVTAVFINESHRYKRYILLRCGLFT